MADPRKYTNALADMVDSGIVSADDVLNAALSYMSEDDVKDMIQANDWLDMIESEESPDDDEEWAEITVDSVVTVEGVEYVAAAEIDGCEGCAAIANGLRDKRTCHLLPDCEPSTGSFIFIRKEKQ